MTLGDRLERRPEVSERLDVIELAGLDQGRDAGLGLRAFIVPGEQMVIIPENKRLENWTSPALIIDGDKNEEIEIYRAADPDDPETGRERRACA